MTGVLVIDKPMGPTSHDIVMLAKKRLKAKKVGHLGTLDPIATGVLPLCINDATRLARFLEVGKKEYLATIKLGEETDTYDREGNVVSRGDITSIGKEDIIAAINCFNGKIKQVPPVFSAVKMDGIPLYKLARQGVAVERAARDVEIYDIEIKDISIPFVSIRVVCSRGTYIRSLAFDIGRKLGCGAHLAGLRRIRSGLFSLKDSISIDSLHDSKDDILKENLMSIERLFAHMPSIDIDEAAALKVMNGIAPVFPSHEMREKFFPSIQDGEMVRFAAHGRIIAIAGYKGEDGFKLEKVFKIQ